MSQKTPSKSRSAKNRGIFAAGAIKVPKKGLKKQISGIFVLYWEQQQDWRWLYFDYREQVRRDR